ncbi:hypothetical protein [Planctomycetes bacterium Pan216]|uniref:hypothetical protein n=1 Tax=Kolteria novifilia TaxID=2527975 RepID=UPI0011A8575F
MSPCLHRVACVALIAWMPAILIGCGGDRSGPARFSVSGNVTLNGEPLPAGVIRFTPDRGKGNSGPETIVEFTEGTYKTPTGKGVVPGPHVVSITGYDRLPEEETMFQTLVSDHRQSVSFPEEETIQDFAITVEATPKK